MAEIWWPLDAPRITGEWGNSPDFYARYGQRGHNGIDMGCPVGTPVYACDDGVIVSEGWGQHNSWMGAIAGIYVLIRHTWGFSAVAHLSSTSVNVGQRVTKGQRVAASGATGVGTGPHVHFETFPRIPQFNNGFAGRVSPRIHTIRARGTKPATSPKKTTTTTTKGLGMATHYHREDATAKERGRSLKPGGGFWLHTTDRAPAKNASNCVGGVGPYVLAAHIYAEGTPGDKLTVKYVWQANGKNSAHYADEIEIGSDGKAKSNPAFIRSVPRGTMVLLRVDVAEANRGTVKVTRADSDALLIA